MDTKRLNDLPRKIAPAGATHKRPAPGSSVLFVDYDLLHVSPDDGNIYGNWRDDGATACSDKKVDCYVERRELQDYDFAEPCKGSKDGIYRFRIA